MGMTLCGSEWRRELVSNGISLGRQMRIDGWEVGEEKVFASHDSSRRVVIS
jgi:hypothetical protein